MVLLGLTVLACQNANVAVIKLTNPDGEEVPFIGFYASDLTDSVNVNGVTNETYKIDVDPEDDYVIAGFYKSTTEAVNELKIELSYMGEVKEVKTTKIPSILGIMIVTCEIP
jgi:hypothetical protein